ncbi:protein translocase subunit SecF [Corynebacterium yudongzhengii]|uniref:Protein-export membrane protein SecF n=1 Tax=Corynebacterium yudongzhengii TaxID=2080740 RepID=A0A2U1T483_9CORY|nr:protein translocase subunit SecF [Corynebacterium yudongzhengii]AWB81802.1 protein translocase subunit SecF [Corynebacterium yudongzhengii]PWC00793.1 protein translocase subunit SecF [Corynebacterium yudongzhengii]
MSTQQTGSQGNFFDKLYTGEGGIDFIGRTKTWYIVALVLVLISIGSMIFRGFDLSIDFEGGTKVSMPAGDLVVEEVDETFQDATGVEPELVQIVGAGDSRQLEINSVTLSEEQAQEAQLAIAENHGGEELGVNEIGVSQVSESWGSTITERMIISMAVFLVIASIYVAVRLKREMAIAALAALAVDAVLIAGIYSLFGLEVSPAVVIGLLTVLTFSVYDTVIVFDKVKENTQGVLNSRRATYGEQANLAVNQTLMRSFSTSTISALPIIALFVVAVWLLGVGTLRDLAVIQLIGVIEGLVSSLFLATPFLVSIMNRKKAYREHNEKVANYRETGDDGEDNVDEDHDVDGKDEKRTVVTPTSNTGATWRPNRG